MSDILIRVLGDELQKNLKQPLVIENKVGGAFNIAARQCAEAAPDGHTICLLPGEPLTYNQFLFKNTGFDPDKGFAPITNLFFITQVMAANAALDAKNLDDLARLSKAKPGTLSFTAPGLSQALFIEKFKADKGADLVRVPFKGGGDAINGMLSNATPILFLGLGNVISFIRAGKAIPYVVDGDKRSPLVPDVPTLKELGYHGDITPSYGALFAPAGTPAAIVTKLHDEIAKILNDPSFRDKHMVQRGLEPVVNTPAELQAYLVKDREASGRVVKASGLQQQ
ncbi:MAG: tripartite tricarboxylate transporter substrate binding protein [Xanthobacteraceae bacterium]|nr:tripartite tricarboxylate transporter substrate binding protein [Xanthobacteraceae bacterium]